MTTGSFHTGKTEPMTFFLILGVIVLIAVAGRDIIAWLLMKLYEIFIEQNPFRL
ncbi:MAG: hypothetical protein JNK14_05615 [Chitinophagaceae bacterium]|nr:hypothetical protein [Chitinophagaceae bacterium]